MSKNTKGRKVYKTMRGKPVDMDILRKKNELVPAVGNARVNARGDQLGANGKIIKTREDIMREYYEKNPSAMRNESGQFIPPSKGTTDNKITEQLDLTTEEQQMLAEDDAWVEDSEGNFVDKKNITKPTDNKKK